MKKSAIRENPSLERKESIIKPEELNTIQKDVVDKVLPGFLAENGKRRLEAAKIRQLAKGDSIELDGNPMETDQDVLNYLQNHKKLMEIKQLLETLFKDAEISCERDQLNKLPREKCVALFIYAFAVFPKANFDDHERGTLDGAEEQRANEDVTPKGGTEQAISSKPSREASSITIDEMQEIYGHAQKEKLGDDVDIAYDGVTVYQGRPVTQEDGFWLDVKNRCFYEGCAALVNAKTGEVAAVGHLVDGNVFGEKRRAPHLVFDAKNIEYEMFRKQRKFDLVLVPEEEQSFFVGSMTKEKAAGYTGRLLVKSCQLGYGELETTERILCIDFGTSNTTAGTYGLGMAKNDEIELVHFLDVTEQPSVSRDMLPTLVYVESCASDRPPVYRFGYEARKKLMDAGYDTEASMFHEIKRWITTMDEKEEVFDTEGNRALVTHEEIIKAYLEYIIQSAEQQFKVKFKRLHFTAPVKLKSSFLKRLSKNIFSENEYEIETEQDSLDEGVAIVYHYISEKLRKKVLKENEKEKILILDCGGGTTDLASCTYSFQTTQTGKELTIATKFENGESNFGGNNITFRILQMIKIKIASLLANKKSISMDELIKDETEILSLIDYGTGTHADKLKMIYADFEEAYQKAESIIPTQFSSERRADAKRRKKRNYYYLWQMAEAIKIEFYKANNNSRVKFDFYEGENLNPCLRDEKQYYLWVMKDDRLQQEQAPTKDVSITIKDISRIICPDIYALLTTLLRPYEKVSELQHYFYRLAGQSCKIALFHDLLKEFVPGRLIRRQRGSEATSMESDTLKKYCIEGSIEYIRDKAKGVIRPKITHEADRFVYDVYVESSMDLKPLFKRDGSVAVEMLPDNTTEAVFVVKDANGAEKNKFRVDIKTEGQPYTLTELKEYVERQVAILDKEKLQQCIFDKLQRITLNKESAETAVCLFVLPTKEEYGIQAFPIRVGYSQGGKVYCLPEKTCIQNYENEKLEKFFNGER